MHSVHQRGGERGSKEPDNQLGGMAVMDAVKLTGTKRGGAERAQQRQRGVGSTWHVPPGAGSPCRPPYLGGCMGLKPGTWPSLGGYLSINLNHKQHFTELSDNARQLSSKQTAMSSMHSAQV